MLQSKQDGTAHQRTDKRVSRRNAGIAEVLYHYVAGRLYSNGGIAEVLYHYMAGRWYSNGGVAEVLYHAGIVTVV